MEIKTKFKRAGSSVEIGKIFNHILDAECEVDRNKEHFWVMGLDSSNHIMYIELATLGIVDSTLIAPREVFRLAIMKGVSRIIVCHNHPSNNVNPSKTDDGTTKILQQSGDILGIDFLDHVIICKNDHYSYAENHRLEDNTKTLEGKV